MAARRAVGPQISVPPPHKGTARPTPVCGRSHTPPHRGTGLAGLGGQARSHRLGRSQKLGRRATPGGRGRGPGPGPGPECPGAGVPGGPGAGGRDTGPEPGLGGRGRDTGPEPGLGGRSGREGPDRIAGTGSDRRTSPELSGESELRVHGRVQTPRGPLAPPQPHRPPPPQWQPSRFQPFYQPICSFHRASANVLSRTTEAGTATEMHADVAQLVAHHLAKVRVAGSNPVIRSRGRARQTSFAVPLRTVEWPSGEATACKAVHTGSIPVSTSRD